MRRNEERNKPRTRNPQRAYKTPYYNARVHARDKLCIAAIQCTTPTHHIALDGCEATGIRMVQQILTLIFLTIDM